MPAQGPSPPTSRASASLDSHTNVSKELASLGFEKKNKTQPRLPSNNTIQRRPLNHAPIASPYAGANVQKVVYVSRNTPIMAAVKRVKKLLSHIEKRAMQDVDLMNDRDGMKRLAEASEKLAKQGEEVFVKASGRAMEQALKVADWFRNREEEMSCKVEVRTGSVQAVDDIVEIDVEDAALEKPVEETELEPTLPEDSTGLRSSGAVVEDAPAPLQKKEPGGTKADQASVSEDKDQEKKPRRRRKRKQADYAKDDIPEARVRWIKTIEIVISLKG